MFFMNESHEEQKYHQEKNTKFPELLKDENLKSKNVKENDFKKQSSTFRRIIIF